MRAEQQLKRTATSLPPLCESSREVSNRENGAHNLYVDGGITIQEFLRAGLIQRLIITRVPVLIGDGVPLFGALPRDIRLRHVTTRHYPSGLVQSEYHVAPPPTTLRACAETTSSHAGDRASAGACLPWG